MASNITPEQEKKLQEAFANFQPSRSATAQAAAPASTNLFCQDWPQVKSVLQFLVGLPGVPQQVKDAINMVISAGDTVSGIICH